MNSYDVEYSIHFTFDCWEIFRKENDSEKTVGYSNLSSQDAFAKALNLSKEDIKQGKTSRVYL
jgi:peroxiredoxin family protein